MKYGNVKKAIAFFIVSNIILGYIGAQENADRLYGRYFTFEKDAEFTSLQAQHIRPLKGAEMFYCTHEKGILYVSTTFDYDNKKPYCTIKSHWGNYRLSRDYKDRILVAIASDKKPPFYTCPFYLLDGKKGIIRHIVDARSGVVALADRQVKYLIYIDNTDGVGKPKIGLLDIESGKQIGRFDWQLEDSVYLYTNNMSNLTFYDSRNTNYDFHIVYDIGSFTAAEEYLKIGDKAITTVYDKTSVGAEYYLSNSK